ncbi:helix-turn-helix domain-containing protein [Scandinavium goeteborgense]|uniref:helix-turn-helix domain-containing protein n=1 Tax=Scandinavium goeteborgense TaxID=1851514 RepID=UPI00157404BF|nr:helix-turn-helix domain-containing protein [Scandinavium goeteborgense]QKN82220.1 helix-turn-helix domain-containing protein [Scandinavium goeteborgense]
MKEMTLGQRIKERRKQIGLSQNGLSKAAGVSDSTISLWESDNTAPRGANLHKLAAALQCSPTWVLFGDEDNSPGEPRVLDAEQQLTEDEKEVLRLYRALPESEQRNQIGELKARVENFNRLFTELLAARKRNNQP